MYIKSLRLASDNAEINFIKDLKQTCYNGVYPFKIFPELCPKEQIQKRVAELMDIVGLAPRFANSYPHELDGGRR